MHNIDLKFLLLKVCCDTRIKNSIFNIKDPNHVFVLQEYLIKELNNTEAAINEVALLTSKFFEAGNFPDRQAYNKDGILVTFPSPEYKKRAIDKGTHFAENPKASKVDDLYMPGDEKNLSMIGIDNSAENDQDAISLEQELGNSDAEDNIHPRTKKEKIDDAEAIISILRGGNTDIPNTMTEHRKVYEDKKLNF